MSGNGILVQIITGLMKWFRSNNSPKNSFYITETDRQWVEENFIWLIQVYGIPLQKDQVLLTEKFFPVTFRDENLSIDNLIIDLCDMLALDPEMISYELHKDLRDSYGTPYEIEGSYYEAETEILSDGYKINLAHSLVSRPKTLIFSLIYEFIGIRLTESKLPYDEGEDTSLFIYLAGIYFGFGVLLSINSVDRGRKQEGLWETKWNFVAEIPAEVMIFGLAVYCKIVKDDDPAWVQELPVYDKKMYAEAIIYLDKNPLGVLNQAELDAYHLFNIASQQYLSNQYDEAITTLQKILFLSRDKFLKSDVYNNIGYYMIRKGDIEKSISYLKESLKLNSENGFANDNLGYVLIRMGRVQEGKHYLKNALASATNDHAYSYRNFALYYEAKGDQEKAEDQFRQAFDHIVEPVDLLEFHYGKFLIEKGETDKGMEYLKKAADKGEPEAINLLSQINNER